MLKRLLKLLIGIVLIPVCIGITIAFYELLKTLHPGSPGRSELFFLSGLVSYTILYFARCRMMYLYVFGHEAVHALFSVFYGGNVKSFKVSPKGGNVTTTKNNSIISLSPYFFPFYTVFFSVVFFTARIFLKELSQYNYVFMYLSGFSIAFHLLMTVYILKTRQPDIAQNGYLFSLTLIYIVNIILLALIMKLIFSSADVLVFLKNILGYSLRTVIWGWKKLSRLTF